MTLRAFGAIWSQLNSASTIRSGSEARIRNIKLKPLNLRARSSTAKTSPAGSVSPATKSRRNRSSRSRRKAGSTSRTAPATCRPKSNGPISSSKASASPTASISTAASFSAACPGQYQQGYEMPDPAIGWKDDDRTKPSISAPGRSIAGSRPARSCQNGRRMVHDDAHRRTAGTSRRGSTAIRSSIGPIRGRKTTTPATAASSAPGRSASRVTIRRRI